MSRQRAFVHVMGPEGAGKTTLIMRLLESARSKMLLSAVRCEVKGGRARVSSLKRDPEIESYRAAGATAVCRFQFPDPDDAADAFWSTDFMNDYSEGVVVEGVRPSELGMDLAVFVAPALRGEALLQAQNNASRRKQPPGDSGDLSALLRDTLAGRGSPFDLLESIQSFDSLQHSLVRALRPRRRSWSIAPSVDGIERANVVVINVRDHQDRKAAAQMIADLKRIRTDEAIFRDVVGIGLPRYAITAVAANLLDAKDPEVKKAMTRIRKTFRDAK